MAFLRVFLHESKKLLHSPLRMVWVLVVPLFFFVFLSRLFGDGAMRDIPVSVCDLDQTASSRALLRELEAAPSIHIAQYVTEPAEGQLYLKRGDYYAFIVIPRGFEKDIYKAKPTQAICYTNNQFLLPANFIQKDFFETIIQFSSDLTVDKRMKNGQIPDQAIGAVKKIELDAHVLYNPYTNYSYYLNLGLFPMMFQIVVMMFTAYIPGLVLKRKRGLHLYNMGEGKALSIVIGKLLPYTIVFSLVTWLMDVYLFDLLGVPSKGTFIEGFVLSIFFILAAQFLGFAISAVSPNLRSAVTYGGGFAALAFSFSGYTFPIDGIPLLMKIGVELFPFTHFLHAYIDIAIKGHDLIWTWPHLAALVGYILLGLLTLPIYMKRLQKNEYATS